MKIIDRTPYLSEKGQIGLLDRLQGTLKFGLNWYPEVQAQQAVMAVLERHLSRYTLIRNLALGTSGIVLPLVLVGPGGVHVLYVTHLRGSYQARGEEWGTVQGDRFQSASINLLSRTARLGRALQVYLQRQGIDIGTVEPALLAADPGMHIESIRPIVRVVMSDAIERFAVALAQARPVMSLEAAHELAERIVNPRAPRPAESSPAAAPAPEEEEELPEFLREPGPPAAQEPAGEDLSGSEISFAFEDEPPPGEPASKPSPSDRMRKILAGSSAAPAARPDRRSALQPSGNRIMGMTRKQILLLAAIFLVEICLLAAFFVIVFLAR